MRDLISRGKGRTGLILELPSWILYFILRLLTFLLAGSGFRLSLRLARTCFVLDSSGLVLTSYPIILDLSYIATACNTQ